MKRFKIFVTLAALIFSLHGTALASTQTDMTIIEGRMVANIAKGLPSDSQVESIIATINPEGGFVEIDYKDDEFNSGDKKRKHMQKTLVLAKAYVNEKSKFYQNEGLYCHIESLLQFWLDSDLDDDNWWHRSIGFPKDMMPSLVLMKSAFDERNPKLCADLIHYLDYSWEETPPKFKTGANGTDISKITFTKAVLSGDKELLNKVMSFVSTLIYVAKGGVEEGIYPDNSFSQHSANGRQLYLGTYGREYLDGTLFFMEYTNGTSFALDPEKVTLIEDLVIEGVAWMWYKNELDPNQCGRKIYDKENFAKSFVPITERIIALNTPKNAELQSVLAMMKGEVELIGNKAYPYHDYMIHRGEGYMTTVRMTSTRTVGNEAGNGQGFENYHTGDGATYFKVVGDEYSPIFPKWNWKMIPGTTVVLDDKPMPRPMWGKDGVGGHDFAGVASTASTGVAGFVFAKDQLTAHKAWFNFPTFTVALGAGITTERSDAPVVTTVNQTAFKSVVSKDANAIWHHKIGYKSLTDQEIEVKEDSANSILTLSINHGKNPSGASYAYVVYPNITSEQLANTATPIDILSNSAEVQAVKNNATGEIQAVFYAAATLKIDRKVALTVSQPAIIICTPSGSGYDIRVGNPYCENAPIDSIEVTISNGKKKIPSQIIF